MRLSLTPAQEGIVRAARDYAARSLAPRAEAFEEAEAIPSSVFTELAARGLMAVNLPRETGGSEAGVVAYALAMKAVAAGCAATAVTMAVTNMVGEVIYAFGTEAQRTRYCPALAGGELGAFALSEAGAGSDPGGMRTRAVADANGFTIDGAKQWISHGDISRVLVVWARTGGEGARGVSACLVDGGAPGLSMLRREDKMGLRASRTAALVFDGVKVPASALLGGEGEGFRIAMAALDGGRIGIASQALGIAEGALARVVEAASPRSLVAREGLLGEARARLDAATLLVLRAARKKERREKFTLEASMAKVFATETAVDVCRTLARHRASYPLEVAAAVDRALRDVRVTMIYEGTSEVQRLVIGRERAKGLAAPA
jgi:alkylation response protein AidB-like acyl-CoA dehydrogenase